MEKITLTIGEKDYLINREAVRLLVTMGVLVEVVAPVKEPPLVIAPPKPDIIVSPLPVLPTKPQPVPESDFLGEQYKPNLYRAKEGDWEYLRQDGKLWPRSTPTNPNPEGTVGVGLQYVLPAGWHWWQAKDGAWAIVPHETGQLGPVWLQTIISQSGMDSSTETGTNFLTTPK